jgi:Flp pilus assembly protein TadD
LIRSGLRGGIEGVHGMASLLTARRPFDRGRQRALAAIATVALALGLGGCLGPGDVTGSIGGTSAASVTAPLPQGATALRGYADEWGRRFEQRPADRVAALNYARALRALTRFSEEVAVLREAAIKSPQDRVILGAYGKALADVGQFRDAAEVLAKAHSPERPDWSILSAQGMVADQLGDFDHARGYYAAALKINPGEPTVLSNLGLSYALEKQLPLAETTLRQAADDPRADQRVRQNLALVLALQGKFGEAEQVSRRDLSPVDASANVAAIRQMIAQSNTWRQIQAFDGRRKTPRAAAPQPAQLRQDAPSPG